MEALPALKKQPKTLSKLRNKDRGKDDERDAARLLGGARHPADTGGKEDVYTDSLSIQVKGGLSVTTVIFREAMKDIVDRCPPDKVPAVVLYDRKDSHRVNKYIVFRIQDYVDNYSGDRRGEYLPPQVPENTKYRFI